MFLLEANKVGSVGSSCGLAVECTDLMRLSFVAGKRKSSREEELSMPYCDTKVLNQKCLRSLPSLMVAPS